MQVEAVMFANHAVLEGGLLVINGGGWEFFEAETFPITLGGYVAGVIALDDDELGATPVVLLEVDDEYGAVERASASMIVTGARPEPVPGVPSRVPFAIPLNVQAEGPTIVSARLLDEDGDVLASLSFELRGGAGDSA